MYSLKCVQISLINLINTSCVHRWGSSLQEKVEWLLQTPNEGFHFYFQSSFTLLFPLHSACMKLRATGEAGPRISLPHLLWCCVLNTKWKYDICRIISLQSTEQDQYSNMNSEQRLANFLCKNRYFTLRGPSVSVSVTHSTVVSWKWP